MSRTTVQKDNKKKDARKVIYQLVIIIMGLVGVALLMSMIVVDAFPGDMTVIIVAVMMILLAAAAILMTRSKRWKRVVGSIIAFVFIVIFSSVTYYLGTTYAMINKISGGNYTKTKESSINLTEEPFNVYITGIDQWESEIGMDLERSDVNMIVTVNPVTKKVLLTSIPRDTYVKLHTAQQMDKLTHSGIYGVDETLGTVEDWLDIKLNYYVKMNFSAVRAIIDAMDGVDVYSPVAFESSLKGYEYKKGWNHLYGRRALYFARERKAFEGQDAVRVENQQRVMKAIIKKLTSSTTLLTRYGDIMQAAGNNLETNMSYGEIRDLVRMQISDLSSWDIQAQKIEGEYGMDYVASLSSKNKYSIYRADEESVKKCIGHIEEIENPTEEEIREAVENRQKIFLLNMANKVKKRFTSNDYEQEQ